MLMKVAQTKSLTKRHVHVMLSNVPFRAKTTVLGKANVQSGGQLRSVMCLQSYLRSLCYRTRQQPHYTCLVGWCTEPLYNFVTVVKHAANNDCDSPFLSKAASQSVKTIASMVSALVSLACPSGIWMHSWNVLGAWNQPRQLQSRLVWTPENKTRKGGKE